MSKDLVFPARILTVSGNGLPPEEASDTRSVSMGDGAIRAKKDASVSLRLILNPFDLLKQDFPVVTRISWVK